MSDWDNKQDFEIVSPSGERIFTTPGKNGLKDMIILSEFPRQPWATSLYYIGTILRLKGMVEDRNYPNLLGKAKLMEFINRCIANRNTSLLDLCKEFQIPGNWEIE